MSWSRLTSSCNWFSVQTLHKYLNGNFAKQSLRSFKTQSGRRPTEELGEKLFGPVDKVGIAKNGVNSQTPGPSLLRPLLFTVGFSGTVFVGATVWQYESALKKAQLTKDKVASWVVQQFSTPKHGEFRQRLNAWWNTQTEGQKWFYGILLLNTCVFLGWRNPNWHRAMTTYFASSPQSRATSLPLLLSVFSHYSMFHLGANMYVLHSFASWAAHAMGKEHFTAFYLSAGVIASFASLVHKTVLRSAGLSLGASGAIMGVVAYVCTRYPDVRLSILFLPQFTFTADTALKALIIFDSVGLLLRWRMLDHAAHLGGAVFGLWWAYKGEHLIWHKREPLLRWYHDFRSRPQ
nr:EOG090X07NR [Triops cancriformis]